VPLLLLLGLASGGRAAAPCKVAVYFAQPGEDALQPLADDLASALTSALAALPATGASRLRPAGATADQTAGLSAGELARVIVAVSEADLVLLAGLTRDAAGGLLANLCLYDRRRDELDLPPPVRGQLGAAGPANFEAIVAQTAAAWVRARAYPRAEVVECRADPPRQEVLVRLDGPLPPSDQGYGVERLGPPLTSEATAEHFAPAGYDLGRAELERTEADTLWLSLSDRIPLAAGARLRLRPPDDGPRAPAGGLVLTTRPWGAVATVDDQVAGLTPLRLALPLGDCQVGVTHALGQPWRRAVTAEERRAGLLAVSLVAPPPPPPPPVGGLQVWTAIPGAAVRLDGRPVGLTPLSLSDVPAGVHQVEVTRGGLSATRSVTVAAGAVTRLDVPLYEPAATAPAATARLAPGQPRVMPVPPAVADPAPTGLSPRTSAPVAGAPAAGARAEAWRPPPASLALGQPRAAAEVQAAVAPPGVLGRPGGSAPTAPAAPATVAAGGPLSALRATPFIVRQRLWERQAGIDGSWLYLALVELDDGQQAVVVNLGPLRPSVLTALDDGFAVDFPGLTLPARMDWPVVANPRVLGLSLESAGPGGALRVRLRLAAGVTVRVHASSTPDNLRFVLADAAPGRVAQ
jgi:hypothetical protein